MLGNKIFDHYWWFYMTWNWFWALISQFFHLRPSKMPCIIVSRMSLWRDTTLCWKLLRELHSCRKFPDPQQDLHFLRKQWHDIDNDNEIMIIYLWNYCIPVLDQSKLLGMTPSFLLLLTMSNVVFNFQYFLCSYWKLDIHWHVKVDLLVTILCGWGTILGSTSPPCSIEPPPR